MAKNSERRKARNLKRKLNVQRIYAEKLEEASESLREAIEELNQDGFEDAHEPQGTTEPATTSSLECTESLDGYVLPPAYCAVTFAEDFSPPGDCAVLPTGASESSIDCVLSSAGYVPSFSDCAVRSADLRPLSAEGRSPAADNDTKEESNRTASLSTWEALCQEIFNTSPVADAYTDEGAVQATQANHDGHAVADSPAGKRRRSPEDKGTGTEARRPRQESELMQEIPLQGTSHILTQPRVLGPPRSQVVEWTKERRVLRVWGRRGRAYLSDSPPVIVVNQTRKSPRSDQENEPVNTLPSKIFLSDGTGSFAHALRKALRQAKRRRPALPGRGKNKQEGTAPEESSSAANGGKSAGFCVPFKQPKDNDGPRRYSLVKLRKEFERGQSLPTSRGFGTSYKNRLQ